MTHLSEECDITFEAGSDVLIIRRVGSRFYAVLNTSDALVDP